MWGSTYDLGVSEEHTGPEPAPKQHICVTCGKSSPRRRNLECHFLTHTGDKQYACSFCPKRFPRQDTLKEHVKRRHQDAVPF